MARLAKRAHNSQARVAEPCADYVLAALDAILAIHRTQAPGDVLVFLSGRGEIEALNDLMREHSPRSLVARQLYAGIDSVSLQRAFERTPEGTRKVVLATNIAEASVTVDGVVYVIDSGVVKASAILFSLLPLYCAHSSVAVARF